MEYFDSETGLIVFKPNKDDELFMVFYRKCFKKIRKKSQQILISQSIEDFK